jgi:hypothetical protein
MAKYDSITGEMAVKITCDVGNGVAPEDSKIDYGPEELAFRREVEEQFAEYRKKDPQAILDVRD